MPFRSACSITFASTAPVLALAVALVCQSCTNRQSVVTTPTTRTSSTAAPTDGHAETGAQSHALHNVHRIGSKLISGAVPEGAAAFDELKAMGVKTIISVDGATPDLEMAAARGMRYVHIPITYAEANAGQQLEIARAVRDLPGPIFLHCHHGKHRGPAAAASAAVLLGEVSAEEGVAFMKKAGTAATYTGLYACVANAAEASPEAIGAAPDDFPALRKAAGIVAAMVEVDMAYELLGEIRAAGWRTPKDHPDLVPAAEAGRLTDNLRFGCEDPKTKKLGEDFAARMVESVRLATVLEEGIVRGASREELEAAWKPVAASCKECHMAYRDIKLSFR